MTDCTLEASMYRDVPELLVTIDTDSWIETEFEIEPEYEKLLDEYREELIADPNARPEVRRDAWDKPEEGCVMETFPAWRYERARKLWDALSEEEREQQAIGAEPAPPTGFYGEGEPVHVFTPNGETFLSIDLQFVLWEDENGSHVVLRKADAYNGYGESTAYRVLGDDGTEPLDYATAIIACDGGSDPQPEQPALDGSKWEPCRAVWDHIPGSNGVDQGHGFGVLPGYRTPGDYTAEVGSEPRKGVLVIDHDEKHAFCPYCGRGKLQAFKN